MDATRRDRRRRGKSDAASLSRSEARMEVAVHDHCRRGKSDAASLSRSEARMDVAASELARRHTAYCSEESPNPDVVQTPISPSWS